MTDVVHFSYDEIESHVMASGSADDIAYIRKFLNETGAMPEDTVVVMHRRIAEEMGLVDPRTRWENIKIRAWRMYYKLTNQYEG